MRAQFLQDSFDEVIGELRRVVGDVKVSWSLDERGDVHARVELPPDFNVHEAVEAAQQAQEIMRAHRRKYAWLWTQTAWNTAMSADTRRLDDDEFRKLFGELTDAEAQSVAR